MQVSPYLLKLSEVKSPAPETVDLTDFFPPSEGTIDLYYGHIRNGKTYGATVDALQLAGEGVPVYCNWPIQFSGVDERTNWTGLLSLLWPFQKRLFRYGPKNLRYYEISDEWARKQGYKDFWAWFLHLTDCVVFADEGHVLLDSYKKTYISMEERNAVLHTGHFNRRVVIVSQRPTAVHVSARGNVNRFFKFEKVLHLGNVIIFRKTEYQDMVMDNVDETKPLRTDHYFARRKIMDAYDSKYLRKGLLRSQEPDIEVYNLKWPERLRLLIGASVSAASNWGIFAARKGVKVPEEKTLNTGVGSTLLTPGEDNEKLPF